MKRKFLAKAITLGLMLAVPLGAYAEEILPDAQGVMISNVDGKTAAGRHALPQRESGDRVRSMTLRCHRDLRSRGGSDPIAERRCSVLRA